MGTYRPLYNIRIEHEYFDGNICRAMQCRISPSGHALCHRRGLLFRQHKYLNNKRRENGFERVFA